MPKHYIRSCQKMYSNIFSMNFCRKTSTRDRQKETEPFKRSGSLKRTNDPWLFFARVCSMNSVHCHKSDKKWPGKKNEPTHFSYSLSFVSRLYYNACHVPCFARHATHASTVFCYSVLLARSVLSAQTNGPDHLHYRQMIDRKKIC